MPSLKKLEMYQVIGHSDVTERGTESSGAKVQVVLVPRTGVDPDRPQPPQGIRVAWHHPYRVPVQPPLPHGWPDHPGRRIERQLNCTVLVSREARGHAEHAEQRYVLLPGEG